MKQIIKTFETRLSKMTEQKIIDLSQNDNGILNVVHGLHKQSFGTYLWDDGKPNFDYFIFYVTKNSADKLEGYMLRLQPLLKTRNELTTCFVSLICKRYNVKDHDSIFNTYQDQQRSLFERYDYWTYNDTLLEELNGKKGKLILKGHKGILYVPFARQPTDDIKKSDKNKTNQVSRKIENNSGHYVYIMHNRHNNYYKIGRSKNPEHREKTLQAQEPDVTLIDKWLASAEVESTLHRKFKSKRKRGEWFILTNDDITEIRTFMTTYTKSKKNEGKKTSR